MLYFQFNLLSVKRLSEQLKCEFVLSEHACVLQGPYLKRPLEIDKSTHELYILDDEVARRLKFEETNGVNCNSSFFNSKKEHVKNQYSFNYNKDYNFINIWHNRMGHISFRKL